MAVGLVGVARADAGPDAMHEVPWSRLQREVAFVEGALGSSFPTAPRVLVGTRDAILRYVPREEEAAPESKEEPATFLMALDGSRRAFGLPDVEVHRRLLVDVPGYYSPDDHVVVLRSESGSYEPAIHSEVLVHELTHALVGAYDRRHPFDFEAPDASATRSTHDAEVAGWMMDEGRATFVESEWRVYGPIDSEPTTEDGVLGATPQIPLGAIGYRLGELRAEAEVISGVPHRYEAAMWNWGNPPSSAGPFWDPALPLDWTPRATSNPSIPRGAQVVTSDRVGPLGWTEVIASAPQPDFLSASAWRGDTTVAYQDEAGTDCVASNIVVRDRSSAIRLDRALSAALTDRGHVSARGSIVALRTCSERAGSRTPVTLAEPNYGALWSRIETAYRLAYDTDIEEPALVNEAMCASDRLHEWNYWADLMVGQVSNLGTQTEAAHAACRVGADSGPPPGAP